MVKKEYRDLDKKSDAELKLLMIGFKRKFEVESEDDKEAQKYVKLYRKAEKIIEQRKFTQRFGASERGE